MLFNPESLVLMLEKVQNKSFDSFIADFGKLSQAIRNSLPLSFPGLEAVLEVELVEGVLDEGRLQSVDLGLPDVQLPGPEHLVHL